MCTWYMFMLPYRMVTGVGGGTRNMQEKYQERCKKVYLGTKRIWHAINLEANKDIKYACRKCFCVTEIHARNSQEVVRVKKKQRKMYTRCKGDTRVHNLS